MPPRYAARLRQRRKLGGKGGEVFPELVREAALGLLGSREPERADETDEGRLRTIKRKVTDHTEP